MKEVIVKNNYSRTTNGYPVHRIEFDGVTYDVIGNEITLREADIFKGAILAERERIWNKAYGKINTEMINNILNSKKEKIIFYDEKELSEYLRAGTGQHISFKKYIMKNVLEGKEVIIVDVNNEYKKLVDSINLDNIKVINLKSR
ncbi:hypothetical protein [Clostridium baratii]|uniref:hypothetical protein n=1 Tax=Clostridium baratii TaxID=1561 RepID=UPI0030CC85AE